MQVNEIVTKKIKVNLTHEEWENVENAFGVIENLHRLMLDSSNAEIGGIYYNSSFICECYSFIYNLLENYDKTITIYPEDLDSNI